MTRPRHYLTEWRGRLTGAGTRLPTESRDGHRVEAAIGTSVGRLGTGMGSEERRTGTLGELSTRRRPSSPITSASACRPLCQG
jgi:hypothetical protein